MVILNVMVGEMATLPMSDQRLYPFVFPIIPTGPMMYVGINNWDGSSKAVEEPLTVGMMPI